MTQPFRGLRRAAIPILLGVGFIALTDLAIRHTELVTGRYVSSGVPPIPAFAALLLLLTVQPALRRLSPRLVLDRGQLLLIYAMMTVGVVLGASYLVRGWLPHLVALPYWSRHDPALIGLDRFLPSWYAPQDPEAVRLFYEGAHTHFIPWAAWARPLALWSLFFLAVYGGVFCLVILLHQQWIHHERLTFPLLYLPLTLTAPENKEAVGGLFRRWLFWGGFGVALVFNGLNIGHALHPAIPGPGFYRSLYGLFPRWPWTPFNSVNLFFMLEAIGFGYFIPLEVTFSTWFCYFGAKLFAVAGLAWGYEEPGFPFLREQSAGAYFAVAAFLLWGSRRHWLGLLRCAFGWRHRSPVTGHRSPVASHQSALVRRGPPDPVAPADLQASRNGERTAWLGLIASAIFVLVWCWKAQFSLWIATPYFAVLFCFVLVYARIRAETGAPFEFIYPYGLPKDLVVESFSVPGLLDVGGLRGMVMFSSLAWLSRHHYAEAMAAYQLDALKLAEAGQLTRRVVIVALTLAFLVGLAGATWAHLSAYYELGCNLAGGGTGQGEYRARVALQEYQWTATQAAAQPPRNGARLRFAGLGFGVAFVVGLLRVRFIGFPLHPLGFILATAYGDSNTAIFPFFMAWLAKWLILKIGSLKLYRRGIPFFIGLIVGHFFLGGVFWPVLSLTVLPDASQAYHLYFGG